MRLLIIGLLSVAVDAGREPTTIRFSESDFDLEAVPDRTIHTAESEVSVATSSSAGVLTTSHASLQPGRATHDRSMLENRMDHGRRVGGHIQEMHRKMNHAEHNGEGFAKGGHSQHKHTLEGGAGEQSQHKDMEDGQVVGRYEKSSQQKHTLEGVAGEQSQQKDTKDEGDQREMHAVGRSHELSTHRRGGNSSSNMEESIEQGKALTETKSKVKVSHQIPLWYKIVFPVLAIILVGLFVLRHAESHANEKDIPTDESLLKSHPLLCSSSRTQLVNPDESVIQKLQKDVTPCRVIALFIALVLALCANQFIPKESMAISTDVLQIADKEGCQARCHETERALCGEGDLVFKVKWCDGKGDCQADQKSAQHARTPKCSFKVVPMPWKVEVVLVTLILSVLFIVQGASAEVVLIGASCFFASLGIISSKQALMGFANSGVVGLALLFPIAAAIEETGLLEAAITVLLGNPKSFPVALFRMMLPTCLLSAFLSNTAVVAMMIPIVISWARRLGVSPGKLLMPLSYAGQIGGTTTLIGSSLCLVAKESVDPKEYDMQFFDLAPIGGSLCLVTMVFIGLCIPLLSSSAEESAETDTSSKGGSSSFDEESNLYTVVMLVRKRYNYDGAVSAEICEQLERLPGVVSVQLDGVVDVLVFGSRLVCKCKSNGIVALRRIRDLELENHQDLASLGGHRRKRHLYEVVVRDESSLVGLPIDASAIAAMRQAFMTCPVAVRGTDKMQDKVKGGDVWLVEADERRTSSEEWCKEFSLTVLIKDSSPPRMGGFRDKVRGVLVCCGMVTLISLVTFNLVGLAVGAGVFVVFLIVIRARSVQEVYESMKAPVLLTIGGAFGLSEALQATGIARFMGANVVQYALPGGKHAIRAAVYFIAAFLSMFMNNSATVAIMGPMAADMAAQAAETNISVQSILFAMIYGAGACLTTPLGYQTNLMVMKDGGYTFGDFTKFGVPIQLLHMCATVGLIWVFSDLLGL